MIHATSLREIVFAAARGKHPHTGTHTLQRFRLALPSLAYLSPLTRAAAAIAHGRYIRHRTYTQANVRIQDECYRTVSNTYVLLASMKQSLKINPGRPAQQNQNRNLFFQLLLLKRYAIAAALPLAHQEKAARTSSVVRTLTSHCLLGYVLVVSIST